MRRERRFRWVHWFVFAMWEGEGEGNNVPKKDPVVFCSQLKKMK